MPVVLVEVGGVARSGHLYGDRTGISYEYPRRRHSSFIHTGDLFVYQKPRVGYVGCGVIGEIRQSVDTDRLVCDVLSVSMFDQPVSLKNAADEYYEADPRFWKDKVYWGQGVRPLSSERFEAIVAAAGAAAPSFVGSADPVAAPYADPKTALAVEDYSVSVAVQLMEERFGESVQVMSRNNPGFDIKVGNGQPPTRYVEVKGTQAAESVFFISEGERRFSVRNDSRYTLVIVSGIDLQNGAHGEVAVRDGAVDGPDFELRTTQWRGQLFPAVTSASPKPNSETDEFTHE